MLLQNIENKYCIKLWYLFVHSDKKRINIGPLICLNVNLIAYLHRNANTTTKFFNKILSIALDDKAHYCLEFREERVFKKHCMK